MNSNQKEKIITIGNFDGVHLGHCFLVKEILKHCQSRCELVMFTFNPHPLEIIESRQDFILMESDEKIQLLQNEGASRVNIIQFNDDIRNLSAKDFLSRFIVDEENVTSVYLGYDFKFGKNKEGDFRFAQEFLKPLKINVYQATSYRHGDTIVSSSEIRRLLKAGDCLKANELLGKPYKLSGIIVHGQGRGKTIGFPTTNLEVPKRRLIPQTGVYLTRAVVNNTIFNSITNVGVNPTFSNSSFVRIETHHFGLNADVYDQKMELFFLEKIRDEKKFNSALELKEQISKDVALAKEKHEKIRTHW